MLFTMRILAWVKDRENNKNDAKVAGVKKSNKFDFFV